MPQPERNRQHISVTRWHRSSFICPILDEVPAGHSSEPIRMLLGTASFLKDQRGMIWRPLGATRWLVKPLRLAGFVLFFALCLANGAFAHSDGRLGTPVDRDPSFRADQTAKAVRPHAGFVWRELKRLVKDAGRQSPDPNPHSSTIAQPTSRLLGVVVHAQGVEEGLGWSSYLTWRSRNPRDPPLSRDVS
jgi:hypothetical protein